MPLSMSKIMPKTMKDIARDLGVSISTVSRALKDSPSISSVQKERIQQYAREYNFCPNMIGEALRYSRVKPMKVIGVILPEMVHYFFMSVLSGIEEEARSRGYSVMVAQSNERYDREVDICNDFYKNKVCGIIVSQAKDTKQYDHFQKLMANGIPLVFYDRICTGINCSRVVVDDYMGAYTAVSHLIESGCRRIAFYGSPMNMEISKNRYNGYHDALVKYGLKENPDWVRQCDNRTEAEVVTPPHFVKKTSSGRVLRHQRRYGNRHTLYGEAHGIPCPGRYQHLRLHQRRPLKGLRPVAHDRGPAGHVGGKEGGRDSDRTGGRHPPDGQDGSWHGEDKPGDKRHDAVTDGWRYDLRR